MAEPKLEVEERLDRIDRALVTMALWFEKLQEHFNIPPANDGPTTEKIQKILRGEKKI